MIGLSRLMLEELEMVMSRLAVAGSLIVVLAAGLATAGEYNPVLSIGDAAPGWEKLVGTDGKEHALADLKDRQVVVVVFTCNTCPFAVDYEERLVAFARQHTADPQSKVALVAINSNLVPGDTLEKMKERAEDSKFNFPYLSDETQQVAKSYGAGYTPELFVLNKDRKIVYMGAMDDNDDAKMVKQSYVADAVAAALAGELPKVKETPARGCTIRFKRRRN